MEKVARRGRDAANKPFLVITPKNSDYKIREVLENAACATIRREAQKANFRGQYDILLAFPRPSQSSPQRNQPLGLFYVGESARNYGFQVAYWDARHDKDADFLALAAQSNVVGFSAITGYQLGEFVRLANQVKSNWPAKPIILGGAHATLTDARTNLSDPLVDYVVFGEGELRLPALLRAIYDRTYLPLVDGVGYRHSDGQVCVQESRHVPDLERDLPDVVNQWTLRYFVTAATRNEMILPVSRGCPWSSDSCAFCSVGRQYMGSYRKVPFSKWKAAIEAVHALVPFAHIELEDENSATAIKSSEPYIPYLKEKGITTHLHLRSDQLLKRSQVQWMADMGVIRIHIGVESGNPRVLNHVMHKHESVEDHFTAAGNMVSAGIEMVGTYIVANPTETWSEIRQTLQLAEALRKLFPPKMYRATIYVLAAFPGTPIYTDIHDMHAFCDLLKELEAKRMDKAACLPADLRDRLVSWLKIPGARHCEMPSPKAADTAQPHLAAFLNGTGSLQALLQESRQWLWPMPQTLREWTKSSAAYNPFLPDCWNAIYPVAGMHFNKAHKTAQNFPGWKRALIKPFEILFDLRFHLAVGLGYEWAFKGTRWELKAVGKLVNWAAQRSVGQEPDRTHQLKIREGDHTTLAGH